MTTFEEMKARCAAEAAQRMAEHRKNGTVTYVERAPRRRTTRAGGRVTTTITPTTLEGDIIKHDGAYVEIDGVEATCSRCGHVTESYGTSEASVKRCLAKLREECPRHEKNWYVA